MISSTLKDRAQRVAEASPEFDSQEQQMAVLTYRLLARGRPVSSARIADVAGVPRLTIEESLHSWPLVRWDAQDRVVGFFGLQAHHIQPTHRMAVDETSVYGWCAWDTLFIPEILRREAHVQSVDPHDAHPAHRHPRRRDRSRARRDRRLLVAPRPWSGNGPYPALLPSGPFLRLLQSAHGCMVDRPDMFAVTVDDAFQLGRLANRLRLGAALEHNSSADAST